jgi:uncharacterized lipoprotein YajG
MNRILALKILILSVALTLLASCGRGSSESTNASDSGAASPAEEGGSGGHIRRGSAELRQDTTRDAGEAQ